MSFGPGSASPAEERTLPGTGTAAIAVGTSANTPGLGTTGAGLGITGGVGSGSLVFNGGGGAPSAGLGMPMTTQLPDGS